MRLKLQPARQQALNNDDNLIPLINVVFLMLIFFMVAGQIQASDPASIELPDSSTETPLAEQRHELLINAQGSGYLDGHAIPLSTLADQLSRLAGQNMEQNALVIKVDATLPVATLRSFLQQVHASGINRISLATRKTTGMTP